MSLRFKCEGDGSNMTVDGGQRWRESQYSVSRSLQLGTLNQENHLHAQCHVLN